MKIKAKVEYALAIAVLSAGFGHYVYNALTDYGLRTNKLHELVAAQNDETADHDNSFGSYDGVIVLGGKFLKYATYYRTQRTNSDGNFIVNGFCVGTFKPNTYYTVRFEEYKCSDSSLPTNICDTRRECVKVVGYKEGVYSPGDSSSGDSSSGNSSSGDFTSFGR